MRQGISRVPGRGRSSRARVFPRMCRSFKPRGPEASQFWASSSWPGAELADRAGYLWWDEEPLLAVEEISLPGLHNRQNAMAAAAASLAQGVDPGAVADGLRSFRGVAHRLEEIAVADGVRWVNDSK